MDKKLSKKIQPKNHIPETSKKKTIILKNRKEILDAFFHELDRQMIVHIRLVNADALGLILSTHSKAHQTECIKLVQELMISTMKYTLEKFGYL